MDSVLRRIGFAAIDRLSGGDVTRHISDIRRQVEASAEERDRVVEERLSALLQHATKTVPYYAEVVNSGTTPTLDDFPVLRKTTIRENYDSFLSTLYPERHRLRPVTTSGSYGTPFTFWLTPSKKARQSAEVIYFGQWINYHVGDPHAYMVAKNKSRLAQRIQNQVMMNPTRLTDDWLEAQRVVLRTKRLRFIIGYPSAIRALAGYCERRGDKPEDLGIKGIITISEPLSHDARTHIERVFGCPVQSRYSTEELGVLAVECLDEKLHHLNTASYVFEFLHPTEDRPAKPGELARIVVTDLFSHAMPLIRYEIGDLGILGSRECECGCSLPVLEELHGRIVEQVFNPDGEPISPFAINGLFRDLDGIKQFQFIQCSSNLYRVLLVVMATFDSDAEYTIRERLVKILGDKARIEISYVDSIPPLPSGKRPYILNRALAPRSSNSGGQDN